MQAATAIPAEQSKQRFRRLTHGTAASLLAQAVNVGSQIVIVPMLLSPWGTQRYGEWLSLSATVAYLSVLDLGVQTYTTNRLIQCRATGERQQYTRVLHSAWALNIVMALAAILIVVPALASIPFARWLQLRMTDNFSAWVVTSLLAVQTILAIPFGLVTGVYRTMNDYPREQLTNIGRQAMTTLATVSVALAGGGLIAVAAVQLTSLAIAGLYAWRDIGWRYPSVRLGWSQASRSLAVSFLHPSLLFLVMQLCGAAVLQGSTLMVSGLFGATGVATFVSLRTLANLSQQGISSVRAALWPEVAEMDATGDYHKLRGVHLLLTKLSMLLWFCASVLLYFEGAIVVRLWSKGRITYDLHVMCAVLVLYGSYSLWATSSVMLGAANRHRIMTWVCAISSAVGLGLAYILAGHYGLPGLVYGLAGADLAICALWIPKMTCSIIGQSVLEFSTEVLGRGLIAALPVIAAAAIFRASLPIGNDILRIAGLGAITAGIGVLSLFSIWLNRRERSDLWALARRLIRIG